MHCSRKQLCFLVKCSPALFSYRDSKLKKFRYRLQTVSTDSTSLFQAGVRWGLIMLSIWTNWLETNFPVLQAHKYTAAYFSLSHFENKCPVERLTGFAVLRIFIILHCAILRAFFSRLRQLCTWFLASSHGRVTFVLVGETCLRKIF